MVAIWVLQKLNRIFALTKFQKDMFGKLNEAKQKMEEAKARLETVFVEGEAENGAVKAIVSASKKVKEIIISDELMNDKEQLQDLITVALNRAMEKADSVSEAEMKAVANEMLPGMGGLGNLFGK